MSLVSGEDITVEVYAGGVWKQFVCQRDININVNTETIETTVTGSGNYKTYEPTVHSVTCGFSGVTSLNVPGFITFPDLQAWQLSKTKLLFRVTLTAQDLTVYIRRFYAFITNSTDTGSFDGITTFQLSTIISGAIETFFTPPSPITGNVYRYPAAGDTAPATPGAYTWSTGLTGKTILSIVKDGRGQSDIILSGTPVGNEALYDTTTGDITFAIPFEDVETAPYMLYQNT